MTPARTTYVQVIHPNFKPQNSRGEKVREITLNDYVIVPRLSLRGSNQIKSLVSPMTLARLAILANQLEKRQRETVKALAQAAKAA